MRKYSRPGGPLCRGSGNPRFDMTLTLQKLEACDEAVRANERDEARQVRRRTDTDTFQSSPTSTVMGCDRRGGVR